MTLKDILVSRRIRKGPPYQVTPDGEYWLLRIKLNRTGGDGAGQSAGVATFYLDLRHYRSGKTRAYVTREASHEAKIGIATVRTRADNVLLATSIEQIMVALQQPKIAGEPVTVATEPACKGGGESVLKIALPELPWRQPSPDEEEPAEPPMTAREEREYAEELRVHQILEREAEGDCR
jgi:hypothetical protein